MRGRQTLYLDQWGNRWWAKTTAELAEKLGYSRSSVRRMYRDKKDGRVVHVGYVVGPVWCTAYQPVEIPQ